MPPLSRDGNYHRAGQLDGLAQRETESGAEIHRDLDEWIIGAPRLPGADHVDYLAHICEIVRERAERVGLRDSEGFARFWHILMKGSIISAAEGDTEAAQRAKAMTRNLIEQHPSVMAFR